MNINTNLYYFILYNRRVLILIFIYTVKVKIMTYIDSGPDYILLSIA